ncbi:putative argininosuccinate lyase [Fusarium culmorum]|uniref:argininosuccinate lyase n=1 Tax=Fusarium culmorum TaxID=5516 RepID=A0A2T4GXC2_FUSCU|nr:putative argininosuccinate lyase [Fusarium culmorum]
MATNNANNAGAPAEGMLWGGRFTGGIDPLMHQYNASISYDKHLYKEDILGSIAFARANAKSGIISNDEFTEIERGLREVMKEWEAGTFTIMPNDEDIHTANERRLSEIIGKEIGGKLHTGRSRNEQVVTDMRMWLRERIREIESYLVAFLQVIAGRAEADIDHIMPGYTHLQLAMPVKFSQWLLSYGFSFASDLERLREVLKRVNRSPLGAGALAGNAFGIDRQMMAKELGFEGIMWNSMGAVADRDFVTEFLSWGTMFMGHISRFSEDLIIYSTAEFGFVTGKAGRAFGHFAGVYVATKGIPSTYNKDLQESWEPMLDHVKTVSDSVQIANGILSTLKLRPDRMRASLNPFLLATDVADALVRLGVPFRETHHISGRVVAKSEELGIPMDQLSLEQLQAIDSRFPDNIKDVFNYEASVESRNAQGGTSRAGVLEQIEVLKGMLN